MPKATVRANAQTLPKKSQSSPGDPDRKLLALIDEANTLADLRMRPRNKSSQLRGALVCPNIRHARSARFPTSRIKRRITVFTRKMI